MQANHSLSEQQKLSIHSAYAFTRSATVYLRACLPIVREEDATQLQSLIELGELSLRRLVECFPEAKELSRGGE